MDKFKIDCKFIDSLQKVMPKTQIKNEINGGLSLQGENHRFQIVYCSGLDFTVKFAKVEVKSELNDRIKVLAEDFVPLTTFPDFPTDDYYSDSEAGLVPDLIRPLSAVDLCLYKGQNKTLFVSVDTENLKAGIYEIEFTFRDAANVYSTRIYRLEIVECKVEKCDLVLTNWMHYDCICNYHNVRPFTDKFYRIFEGFLKEYVDIGFNMLYTPLFTPPLDTYIGGERKTVQLINVTRADGKYCFSFKKLDRFINFALKRGIKYFEFSHLFTQWGGKACPKIECGINGKKEKLFGWETPSDSEDYAEFLNSFLPELVGYIKKKKLENFCYFHITDEPRLADVSEYGKCRRLVKGNIGEMKVIDAVSEYLFQEKGLVDVAVPIINEYEGFRKKYDGDLFVYYCCCPADNYYSNRLLCMPLQRTRILGIQLYLNEAKGFLHWGYNFYNTALSYSPIDPYKQTDAGGLFPSGDAFIVYPSESGKEVFSTLRAKAIKGAFEDYRLLKTLEKIKGKDYVFGILAEEKLSGFSVYPREDGWLSNFSDKIRILIKENVKNKENNNCR